MNHGTVKKSDCTKKEKNKKKRKRKVLSKRRKRDGWWRHNSKVNNNRFTSSLLVPKSHTPIRFTREIDYNWSYFLLEDCSRSTCLSCVFRFVSAAACNLTEIITITLFVILIISYIFFTISSIPSASICKTQLYIIRITFLIHNDIYRPLFLTIQKICFLNRTCLMMNCTCLK